MFVDLILSKKAYEQAYINSLLACGPENEVKTTNDCSKTSKNPPLTKEEMQLHYSKYI